MTDRVRAVIRDVSMLDLVIESLPTVIKRNTLDRNISDGLVTERFTLINNCPSDGNGKKIIVVMELFIS